MKLKIALGFVILALCAAAMRDDSIGRNPEKVVAEQVSVRIEDMQQKVQEMLLLRNASPQELLEKYQEIRSAYKKIETYVVFRYPYLDKAINGGPVPSIETEVVVLHKSDPRGLQVIEEILDDPEFSRQALHDELGFLKSRLEILENAFRYIPVQNWEILEASHLAISRMMTLSLSGFDSPVFLLGLNDSRIVLLTIARDLTDFKDFAPTEYEELMKLLNNALAKLSAGGDFQEFDFYHFFRNQLVPLQTQLRNFHNKSGFERFEEVNSAGRAISRGAHLFDPDYLNPYHTMRGKSDQYTMAQVELGRILFFDPVMSINFKRACASCHQPELGFADGIPKSISLDFKGTVDRNAPTLLNSGFQESFFWDMRSKDMNDQILHVLSSKKEFDITEEELIRRLSTSTEYLQKFREAFPAFDNPITRGTIKSALEVYVRSLTALNSKFDRNMRSLSSDFTDEEIRGFNLFMGKGACATCHFAPVFNGYVPPHYQETEGEIIGVTQTPEGVEPDSDLGMFERFGKSYPDADYIKGMFKTPTLRNISETAPYMHNGAFKTLEEVVKFYNEGGAAGRGAHWPQQTLASDSLHLSDAEQNDLIAFMKTLTDSSLNNQKAFPLPRLNAIEHNNRTFGGEY